MLSMEELLSFFSHVKGCNWEDMMELVLVQVKGQQRADCQIWRKNKHLACRRLGTFKTLIYAKQLKPGPVTDVTYLRLLFFPDAIFLFFITQYSLGYSKRGCHWL